jgi:hypothetical protein
MRFGRIQPTFYLNNFRGRQRLRFTELIGLRDYGTGTLEPGVGAVDCQCRSFLPERILAMFPGGRPVVPAHVAWRQGAPFQLQPVVS